MIMVKSFVNALLGILERSNFFDDVTEDVDASQEDLLVDELVVVVKKNLEIS